MIIQSLAIIVYKISVDTEVNAILKYIFLISTS